MQVETVVNRFTDRSGDEWVQRELREVPKRILEEEWQVYIPSMNLRFNLRKVEKDWYVFSGGKWWKNVNDLLALWQRVYPDLVIEFYSKIEG